MYYLQSRYYDPVVGRFLNVDSCINANGDLVGFNMFAYCSNNPVMGYDPTGEWNWKVFSSGAGLILTGAMAISVAVTVLTCGAASQLMFGVATITYFAGAATLANGVAEVVEAGTGYNFVRDGVMDGDEEAYNTYKTVTQTIAEIGTIICGAYYGSNSGNVCFIAGTLVATKSGLVPIEDIQPGDLVWATDEETGETALKEVVQTFRNETEEWVHVKVNGEEITCTPMHPFYSPVKGWTSAIDLRAGDILIMLNGEYVVVEQVQHELLESPETTYNFEVEDYHTYYVGKYSILAHNACDNLKKISTDGEARKVASQLGYSPTKEISHGQKVFVNPKASSKMRYIARDVDSHSGGVWKAASSVKNLLRRETRTGTFSRWLDIRIGG